MGQEKKYRMPNFTEQIHFYFLKYQKFENNLNIQLYQEQNASKNIWKPRSSLEKHVLQYQA